MPHVILEYSENIQHQLDVEKLLPDLKKAILATNAFDEDGIRMRASPRRFYLVGNGDPANAFLHLTIRIRPGRSEQVKTRVCDEIFQFLSTRLNPVFNSIPLGMTFELQEIDIAHRRLKSSLTKSNI